jgi:predicted metal-dependent peptidase
MPSLVRPVANVAVVVDTSGSMGTTELEDALGEIKGILREVGQRSPVTVMPVDADVHSVGRVSSISQVQLEGGGGTDMGAGIAAAERLRPRPDIVVVITDGATPWPATPPVGMRTIIVLLGDASSTPTWARTIRREQTDDDQ